jgi:Undecaprenyl-phosphate galactose phosphotransferase WbaP
LVRDIRNNIKSALLLLPDVAAFYASLFIAYCIRKLLYLFFSSKFLEPFPLMYFLRFWWFPTIFLSFILYERLYIRRLPFWDETRELSKATSAATIAILSILSLTKMSENISRLTIIFLWCFSLFFFPFFRLIGKKIFYKIGLWRDNVIIIGAGSAGKAIARGISGNTHLGYNVIGFLDDDDSIGKHVDIAGSTYDVFGKVRHFTKFVNILNISTVIIAIPSLAVEKLAELTANIQKHTKNILLIPDIKGVSLTNTELHHFFLQQLFLLKINNNLKSPFNRFIKRSLELIISLVFMPLLLFTIGIIGLFIILDSPGPIFYRQPRRGRTGQPFTVYKFRSMYQDATDRLDNILTTDPHANLEWETYFKLKKDPRITRMGAFLRKTSLDELPQIFNVLSGDMSLVGPRPVLDEEITKYYREFSDYYHMVRPGITGLWQVSGRNNLDYTMRVRLDAWYVLNWSVWLDIMILFQTIRVVLNKEGAY